MIGHGTRSLRVLGQMVGDGAAADDQGIFTDFERRPIFSKLSRIFKRSHDREDIRILKDKASVRDHDLGSALNGTDQDIAF